ncbi:TetR family transcriptional regulator [Bradyrhizobium manausense]|uniref:TetR/AcrR family transcriptional regulator n=1 Tax=Bradyrhizobium manausense TaxID=989370 RepID=UPI001BA60733|nr:TetR/AcrR family transcriptional regulator C-terminal domain-containing protein [Bradyrhizobium manausense]MBR0828616.1 TetR family transcriptional regulator [Bradyrhizobium manausense]
MTNADRAVRAGSQQTRREILLVACRFFAERGYAGVSVHQVAEAAGVFPNQLTYHFGSKDGLFIEAAGRLILEAGQAAETAARSARSVTKYRQELTDCILRDGLPAILTFIEAMLIARRRPDLAPQIKATLVGLHEQVGRATSEVILQGPWEMGMPPETAAQNFWADIMGKALQSIAAGATQTGTGGGAPGFVAHSEPSEE